MLTVLSITSAAYPPSSFAYPLDDALLEAQHFNYARSLGLLEALPPGTDTTKYRAWGYLRAKKYDKAIELFLQQNKDDYETLFGLGLAYYLNKEYANAYDYFTQCLAVHKQCAASEHFRGLIKAMQGEKDTALDHYKAALKLDYNLTEAKFQLANAYLAMEQYNDAYKAWSQIADIDPGNTDAVNKKKLLLSHITLKPEEIVRPSRITQASVLAHAPDTAAIPSLRIGILKDVSEFSFWSQGGFIISDASGTVREMSTDDVLVITSASELFKKHKRLRITPQPADTGIIVRDIRYAAGFAWAGTADREYRGIMEVRLGAGGISLVNVVNFEEYLYSVLPSEMISWWPDEALKVQAVIARTQAVYRKDTALLHKKDGFDLCADQHCQVYKGVKQETAKSRKMVDATRGEILMHNGKPVHTLFSSNCGGHTQSSKELKGWGDEPFLIGIYDGDAMQPSGPASYDAWIKHAPDGIFCKPSKYTYYAESRWIRVISQEDIKERLNRTNALGEIKKIIPIKRSKSGHINCLRIEGTKGSVEIEKENVIRMIAPGRLRSTNFIVEGYGGTTDGIPELFIFWGAGWGHAVGLCQSGVAGMTEKGYNYDQILKKYYKDSAIRKITY